MLLGSLNAGLRDFRFKAKFLNDPRFVVRVSNEFTHRE